MSNVSKSQEGPLQKSIREKREGTGSHQQQNKWEVFVGEGVLESDLASFASSRLNDVILHYKNGPNNWVFFFNSA